MNAKTKRSNFPFIGQVKEWREGQHYSVVKLGCLADLKSYGVEHPRLSSPIMGKIFLKQFLDLTAMEISFGILPAKTAIPFQHKHRQNEEVYLFLSGEGNMQVDGQVVAVGEGTAVRVAPEGVRAMRNTSEQEMFYIVIQAKAGSLSRWTGSDGVAVDQPIEWPA